MIRVIMIKVIFTFSMFVVIIIGSSVGSGTMVVAVLLC